MSFDIPQVLVTGTVPQYAKPGDAGADLRASEAAVVPARGRVMVATGTSIALPNGWVGLVHPRSGLAAKSGITLLNTPGTIDAGYRGEIKVIMFNTTDTDFEVHIGDRIAQLVFQKAPQAVFVEVEELPGSARGASGFGSSGVQ